MTDAQEPNASQDADRETGMDSFESELREAMLSRVGHGALPERIGRYRVERELGRGGMGAVYLASDDQLGRQVAIKVISIVLEHNVHARQRFVREAYAVSRIDHPAICHVYEVGEHQGCPFMVMRFVRGRTLAELLQSPARLTAATPPENDLLPANTSPRVEALVVLFEKVALGLASAHDHGLVHRDIKPANLMITPQGEPVVLDFGVAHDSQSGDQGLTITGQMIGTPLYMSPEQVRGDRDIDRRADVFGLAVTLYETLTGQRPFQAPTDRGVYERILNHDPIGASRINRHVSKSLATVVAAGMRKAPDRRYRDMREFARDLRAVLERRPIATKPPTPAERTAQWVARNPLAAAFVVTLLLAMSATSWLWRDAAASESRFQLASHLLRARELRSEHTGIYPSRQPAIAKLDAWKREAEALCSRLPEIDVVLAAQQATIGDPLATLLAGLLLDLQGELRSLRDKDLPNVERRLRTASDIERASLLDAADLWREAIAAIGAPDGPYGGLRLEPQIGLVPLSTDPVSGLWEFAAVETGTVPVRGADRRLVIDASSAVVLVLLPGGTVRMGSTSVHASGFREQPPHDVELAPFLLGKYEVTQRQWLDVMGSNPSSWRPDRPFPSRDRKREFPITLLHPIEHIYSDDAMVAAWRLGLTLPTEAQWEYAARVGCHDDWPTGADPHSLESHANIADGTLADFGIEKGNRGTWRDGYPIHAPIGSFRANAFGLHDMIGNVFEFCRDRRGNYDDPWQTRTGERLPVAAEAERTRVARGGSAGYGFDICRVAQREFVPTTTASEDYGVRFARELEFSEPR